MIVSEPFFDDTGRGRPVMAWVTLVFPDPRRPETTMVGRKVDRPESVMASAWRKKLYNTDSGSLSNPPSYCTGAPPSSPRGSRSSKKQFIRKTFDVDPIYKLQLIAKLMVNNPK